MQKKILIFLGIIVLIITAIFLAQVFSGGFVLQRAVDIGFLNIRFYGLFLALAAGAGLFVSIKRAAKFGIEPHDAESVYFYVLIFGFLGARMFHVLTLYDYYLQHPFQILQIWTGGLAIYGAVIGGAVGLLLAKRKKKLALSTWGLLDWLTPGLIVGQIIGRFGNLFNYELYGFPTSLPWKMFVPAASRPEELMTSAFFHPLFLYEVLGLGLILLALSLYRKKEFFNVPGRLFLAYFLLYNVLRFFIELLRIDTSVIGGFRVNLGLSLAFVLTCALYIVLKNDPKKT